MSMNEFPLGMEFVEFKGLDELEEMNPGSSKPKALEVDPEDLGEFSDGEYDDHAFSKPSPPDAVLIVQNDEVVDVVEID